MTSTEDYDIRCVKCEEAGVIRVTGMTMEGPFYTWFCCNPQCMYQRGIESKKS